MSLYERIVEARSRTVRRAKRRAVRRAAYRGTLAKTKQDEMSRAFAKAGLDAERDQTHPVYDLSIYNRNLEPVAAVAAVDDDVYRIIWYDAADSKVKKKVAAVVSKFGEIAR